MTVSTTGTNTRLSAAVLGLQQALIALPRPGVSSGSWRWLVRRQMAHLRDALLLETDPGADGWAAARESSLLRERTALLGRLSTLGPRVLDSRDEHAVRTDLHRLVVDTTHHVQRLNDLAYDEVELELGGSE